MNHEENAPLSAQAAAPRGGQTPPAGEAEATGSYADLINLRIAVGTVISARPNPKSRKPMIILEIEFGILGRKTTSAMITDQYTPEGLIGRQVVAATGMPVKSIAGIKSEVLLLAATTELGSVLVGPDHVVTNGVIVR